MLAKLCSEVFHTFASITSPCMKHLQMLPVGSEVYCNYQAAPGKLTKCIVSYDSAHMVDPKKRLKCMCRLSGLEEKIHICTVLGRLFFEQKYSSSHGVLYCCLGKKEPSSHTFLCSPGI